MTKKISVVMAAGLFFLSGGAFLGAQAQDQGKQKPNARDYKAMDGYVSKLETFGDCLDWNKATGDCMTPGAGEKFLVLEKIPKEKCADGTEQYFCFTEADRRAVLEQKMMIPRKKCKDGSEHFICDEEIDALRGEEVHKMFKEGKGDAYKKFADAMDKYELRKKGPAGEMELQVKAAQDLNLKMAVRQALDNIKKMMNPNIKMLPKDSGLTDYLKKSGRGLGEESDMDSRANRGEMGIKDKAFPNEAVPPIDQKSAGGAKIQ